MLPIPVLILMKTRRSGYCVVVFVVQRLLFLWFFVFQFGSNLPTLVPELSP